MKFGIELDMKVKCNKHKTKNWYYNHHHRQHQTDSFDACKTNYERQFSWTHQHKRNELATRLSVCMQLHNFSPSLDKKQNENPTRTKTKKKTTLRFYEALNEKIIIVIAYYEQENEVKRK